MKLLVSFVIVLALFATACSTGKAGSSTSTSNGSPASTSSTPAPPATPAPSAAPPPATGAATAEYTPTFEDGACAFDLPPDTSPRCGYLVVPEDRDNPDGQQVRLHVAIFEATGDNPVPDPVIYLDGGPGGYTLDQLQLSFSERFAPFTEDRDLILFDQRGVGFSEPNLACPEVREVGIELLDQPMTPEEYNEQEAVAVAACSERLRSGGVDVTAYTSADNATDVDDLRIALGYDMWNLYGISYGTRLGLTTMRDHPTGIRSVVLDSTVPLQNEMLVTGPAAAQRSLDAFFADCVSDARCDGAYPQLEDSYHTLVSRLNDSPASIEVQNFSTGASYPATLTGNDLVGLMFQGMYSEQIIPLLPTMLANASGGDFALAERVASAFFTQGDYFSYGMYVSVQCSEEYAFTTVTDAEEAAASYPEIEYIYADPAGEYNECDVWGAGTSDAIETQPVTSSIPTLIMAGEFDPITPPSYGETVAADLEASFFYEFPGLAHGVTTAGVCPLGITLGFLDEPTTPPDATCIADLSGPSYLIPGDVEIVMVPFSEDFLNVVVSGVAPEDWTNQGFGAFIAPGLGDSGIVQQAVPGGLLTFDAFIADLSGQFSVPADGWNTTLYEDTRSWTIFSTADGELLYDVALAEDGGFLYIVILLTSPEVHDEYFEKVLKPALAAIQVG